MMDVTPPGRLDRRRVATVLAVGAVFFIAASTVYSAAVSTMPAADAYTYLGAGERLNAGHALYALSPGDRPVVLYYGTPLAAPPLVAVLWRPLAALPDGYGRWVWWAAQIVALGGLVAFLLRKRLPAVSIAVYVLAMPIGFEMALGNMNGFLAVGATLVWLHRDRWWAGAIVAVIVSLKLAPLVLVAWLIGQRRWSGLLGVAVGMFACLALVAVGAGLQSLVDYIAVASQIQPSGQSIANLTGIRWLPYLGLALGAVLAVVLRSRPSVAFAVACASMVFASPILSINWFVLFLPAIVALTTAGPISMAGRQLHSSPKGSGSRGRRARA